MNWTTFGDDLWTGLIPSSSCESRSLSTYCLLVEYLVTPLAPPAPDALTAPDSTVRSVSRHWSSVRICFDEVGEDFTRSMINKVTAYGEGK
jgi:hypothetical protein